LDADHRKNRGLVRRQLVVSRASLSRPSQPLSGEVFAVFNEVLAEEARLEPCPPERSGAVHDPEYFGTFFEGGETASRGAASIANGRPCDIAIDCGGAIAAMIIRSCKEMAMGDGETARHRRTTLSGHEWGHFRTRARRGAPGQASTTAGVAHPLDS